MGIFYPAGREEPDGTDTSFGKNIVHAVYNRVDAWTVGMCSHTDDNCTGGCA
jgi:hypothetical protein